MKTEQITIPKRWFTRLNEVYDTYMNSKNEMKKQSLDGLLGYLASVETILKLHDK